MITSFINLLSASPLRFPTGARLTCRDVAHSKEADPRVTIHGPLLGLTVGLTAVVHEARVVSLWTCVNDAVLKKHTAIMI